MLTELLALASPGVRPPAVALRTKCSEPDLALSATSPLHALREVIVPNLHVHDIEPVAVVVASRLDSEIQNVPCADVHAPLDLLSVRLRVRIRVVRAFQQRLRAPRPVRLEPHNKVHTVAADGPHLRSNACDQLLFCACS